MLLSYPDGFTLHLATSLHDTLSQFSSHLMTGIQHYDDQHRVTCYAKY